MHHSLSSSPAVYRPDSGADSSFPERHLDDLRESPTEWPGNEDITQFSPINPEFSEAGLPKLQNFELNNSSAWSQGWLSQPPQLLHRPQISANTVTIEPPILHHVLRQTTSPVQTEWDIFRASSGHSPGHLQWTAPQRRSNVEEDSDSNQSLNDSIEEFCPPLSTWNAAHEVRRRSTHRIAKPTRLPIGPAVSHHIISDRQPNESSPNLFDFASTSIFHAQSTHDQMMLGDRNGATSFGFPQGEELSAEKVHSKRIAHKLSEKTRRNRLTLAIREIQKLLPSECDRDDLPLADSELLIRPGVPSSKLDVVEMAIGFIRKLKEENVSMSKRLHEIEKNSVQQECWCRKEEQGQEKTPPAEEHEKKLKE
ncbi:hypothetical protein QBC40DRAFT_10299 [Triangularia verruculosa]|uniref:BHLH domain-containing protein n=1 Tax=Triangularia verruculosa TaxID=2587418 RepID=A0AAN6XA63_9PEZI|nr:hypothetical protein QBC40DRAFT_10299 [Triangularia verruculosa]